MTSSPLVYLLLTLFGFILFVFIARILPHKGNSEQNNKWKVSLLFAGGAFAVIQLAIPAVWLAEIVRSMIAEVNLSSREMVPSFFGSVLGGSCLGIFFGMMILLLTYWKIGNAPWLSFDLQAGASLFDSLVQRFRKNLNRSGGAG